MRCGTVGHLVPAEFAQWPRSCMQLSLFCNFSALDGLDLAGFTAAARESVRNCSEVSGLKIVLTEDERNADIRLAGEAMTGSVLAYAFFPSGNCNEQLQTRFNSRVNWSHALFLDTLTHELGHCFGLPHTSDRRDIMYPSIISGRELNGRYGPHYSIPELIERYGQPGPAPPPTPPPGPQPPPSPPTPPEDPPMPWEKILELILELIRECNAVGTEVRTRLRRPRLLDWLRVSRKLRNELGRSVWEAQGAAIMETLKAQAEELDDADIEWIAKSAGA